jgi:ketosteroid isomerase-like protein
MMCSLAHAAPCTSGQTKEGNALVQIEQAWAQALDASDTATLGCILADEFEDAGPDGKLTDRSVTLAKAAQHRGIHHMLSELRAHVQGDFGYIRGRATATDAQGKVMARVRFTDVYAYRDGRWQCVAGHESMISGAEN